MSKDIILKGEGGKGGAARQPVEAENTLKATTVVEVLEVWSEGPIVGLENGWKDVFLNQTPVENADGTKNFQDVEGQFRVGDPSQTVIPGFEEVSSVFPSGVAVTKASSVTQIIQGEAITSAYVTLSLNSGLWDINIQGDRNEKSVSFNIHITQTAPTLGSEYVAKSVTLTGKTMDAYQVQYRISPPEGATAWQFRIERVSDDDIPDGHESSMFDLGFWTEVQTFGEPLTYENTAIAGLKVPAQEVGNQIPTRGYLPKGIICGVPSNWDYDSKTFTGAWDGNFKQEWTEDPAWVLYDVVANLRYGIGESLGQSIKVNKWELYDCSVYNNGQLDNGFGVNESRFTFNALIQKQVNGWQLLQTIASVMKAVVTIDTSNQISVVQDRPTETSKLITNSNVIGGLFTYNSSDVTERPTAVSVTFNDREDRYLPRTVQEPEATDEVGNSYIEKYGYNPIDLVAYATTTEAQARRLAKHVLYAANNEYDNVVFAMGMNIVGLQIGDVVGVLDNDYITADNTTFLAGRVLSVAGATVVLDRPVDLSETGFTFSVMSEDYGSIIEETTQTTGTTDTIVLDSALPAGDYTLNDFYCTKTAVIEPRLYRILAIEEKGAGQYTLTCNFYDPQKWDVVELGVPLVPYAYNIQKPLPAITGLAVTEDFRNDDILATNLIRLTWDYNAKHLSYEIRINLNKGKVVLYETAELFLEFENIPVGEYAVTIRAVGLTRTLSPPVSLTYTYGADPSSLLPPLNFQVSGGGLIFNSDSVAFTWEYNAANNDYVGSLKDYVVHLYTSDGLTQIGEFVMPYDVDPLSSLYRGGQQVFTKEAVINYYGSPVRSFMLKMHSRDLIGRLSPTSIDIVVTNPAPAAPAGASSVSGLGRDINIKLDPGYTPPDASSLIVAMGSPGFSPTAADWNWKTPASAAASTDGVAIRAAAEGTFYIRFAVSDNYNDSDLNWTAEYTIVIEDGEAVLIFPTPAAPTGLTHSQVTTVATSGEVSVLTTLLWDANPDPVANPLSGYTVRYKNVTTGEVDVDYSYADVSENRVVLPFHLADKTLEAEVRANYGDAFSAYSTPVYSFSTIGDTVGPTAPLGFAVTDGKPVVECTWALPPEADYAYTEIIYSQTSSFPGDPNNPTVLASSAGNSFILADIPAGQTGYFWARTVDTTGNPSTVYVPDSSAPGEAGSTVLSENNAIPGQVQWAATPVTQSTQLDSDGKTFIHTTINWEQPSTIAPPALDTVTHYAVSWRVTGTTNWMETTSTETSLVVDLGLLNKTYDIRVAAVNGEAWGVWSSILPNIDTTTDTTGPSAVTSVAITQDRAIVDCTWTPPIEEDYNRTEVWGSLDTDFNNAIFLGDGHSAASIGDLPPNTTGYLWFLPYDNLGNPGTWYPSITLAGLPGGNVLAPTYVVPDAPTWGATSQIQENDAATGEVVVHTTINWVAPAQTITGYQLRWRTTTTDYQYLALDTNTLLIPLGMLEVEYDVYVQAIAGDKESLWSLVQKVTPTVDATGPATPTNVEATDNRPIVDVTWDLPTEVDYKETEVHASFTTTFGDGGVIGVGKGTRMSFADIDPNTSGYFWVRHKDTVGNYSAWSPLHTAAGTPGSTEVTATFVTPTLVPTGIGLSQITNKGSDGSISVQSTISWATPTEVHTGADIVWRSADIDSIWGDWNHIFSAETSLLIPDTLSGSHIQVNIAVVNGTETGPYTTDYALDFTAGKDTTAPPNPTGLTATQGLDIVTLNWDNCTETDYKVTQVYWSSTNIANAEAGAVLIASVKGSTYVMPDLAQGLLGYFWVRHWDTSSNATEFYPFNTNGVVGTTSVLKSRDPSAIAAPTVNNPSITKVTNADGSMDATVKWNWGTATEKDVTGFQVILRPSLTNDAYTIGTDSTQETIHLTAVDKRELTFYGIPIDTWYTVGIRVYRTTDEGINGGEVLSNVVHALPKPFQGASEPIFGGELPWDGLTGVPSLGNSNLLPVEDWVSGSTGSQGDFIEINTNNSIILGDGPNNEYQLLWNIAGDSVATTTGGWSIFKEVDSSKSCRVSVWVKQTSLTGSITVQSRDLTSLSNVVTSFPDFFTGDLPKINKWYLVVGMIHAYNHTSNTDTNVSGVYDPETGYRVTVGEEFKFSSNSSAYTLYHRTTAYNISTGQNVRATRPRLEIIDGNEPTIMSMLSYSRGYIDSTDSGTFIGRPAGGMYSFTGTANGVLQIKLPQYYSSTMIRFVVDIFMHGAGSFSLDLSGYTYPAGSNWSGVKAMISGDTSSDNRVRFGHVGGVCAIWVGETSNSWNHPTVGIRELLVSSGGYEAKDWNNNWEVSVEGAVGTVSGGDLSDNLVDSNTIKNQGNIATLDVVTANEINVNTLSAISADMGTVTAGDLSTTGYVRAEGAYASPAGPAAVVGNTLRVQDNGVVGYTNKSAGAGVLGDAATSGVGVLAIGYGAGTKALSVQSNGRGIHAIAVDHHIEGSVELLGDLSTVGTVGCSELEVGSTGLVANLNADRLDGYHESSFCRGIYCENNATTALPYNGGFTFANGAGTYTFRAGGTNGHEVWIHVVSDRRLKDNIAPEELGLEFVNALKPYTFNITDRGGRRFHGFMAQDIRDLIGEEPNKDSLFSEIDDTYSIDYVSLIAPLVKAVQELTDQVNTLKAELLDLKDKNPSK